MKKYTPFIAILICVLSTFQSFSIQSRNILVHNVLNEGFTMQLKMFNCDTMLESDYLNISRSDTTFEIPFAFQNISMVLLNRKNSAQIVFILFLDSVSTHLSFSLSNETRDIPAAFKSIKVKSSQTTEEFAGIFSDMFALAFSGQALDTNACQKKLMDHFFKNETNYLSCWLLLNIFRESQNVEFNFYQKSLSNCKFVERFFFSEGTSPRKSNYKISEIDYDSFHKDLIKSCKIGNVHQVAPDFNDDTCTLIFWASWCGPCIQQIKALSQEEKHNNKTYFISVDKEQESGLKSAMKFGFEQRLYFIDADFLARFGYHHIPLHLQLYKNEKKVLKE